MKNRWLALGIIFISFLQFTLNWFCIVPAFGEISKEMNLSFTEVGGIVGMFIAGYGLAHIPGGWFAERYGMRAGMVFGIIVETIGAAISSTSPSYGVLLFGRLLCGIGGSVYIGSAIGLTAAWFRGKELATANGIMQGAGFTVGAAIGLFAWGPVVAAFGWRHGLLVGAGIGLATLVFLLALFPTPPASDSDVLVGHHLGKNSLRRVFGNPVLWIMGVALLGAYGSYFSAAQLLGHYAQEKLKVGAAAADSIGVILMLSGILGGLIGGWLTDRVFGLLPTFISACVIEGIMFLLMPHLNLFGVQIAAAVIGAALIAAFVPWVSIPGEADSRFMLSDVPTAVGLMLSIVAIGGASIPPLFTKIATEWGFDAAWRFQGAVSIGFSLLALLAKAKRAPSMQISRDVELG